MGLCRDLDRPRSCCLFHARRQVDRIPHGLVVHTQIVAHRADHHWARVDTHPHLEAQATRTLQPRTILCHRLLQRQGCPYGSLWRLLDGQRRTKKCHNAVARELVHRALIAVHLVDEQFIQVIHEGKKRFLPKLLTESCIARHIGKQHRYQLALALQPTAIGQDFVS
jgi:hypothetical protein